MSNLSHYLPDTINLVIFVVVTTVVAVTVAFFRRRANRPPPHAHDVLMERAEAFAEKSPFLKNACREYRANRHLSERQVAQVTKAVTRLEGN